MDELVPKDHGEEIAIFRSQVIGPVVHRQLTRGELRGALRELTRQKFRPPGAERTRHFSVPTLERWYYRFRKHGLAALRPQPRKDAGRAKALDERQKQLVCDVRREHPSASAELILATLVRQGSVREGAVSAATVGGHREARDSGHRRGHRGARKSGHRQARVPSRGKEIRPRSRPGCGARSEAGGQR